MKPCSIQTNALSNFTPPRKYVRAARAAAWVALRMAAWNALLIISPLLLVALVGEAYFRLTKPFIETSVPYRFVDGVGVMREPNAELRYANWDDELWVVSHTNSQGFLDREPVNPERAAEGCHIAFIGDSFVEAMEVPIDDKFHAQLEEMAARELPRLGITTQAYGISVTGQINQLPLYDEYARTLKPKVVALVFFLNDFVNNSVALHSLKYGADPDRMPYMTAQVGIRGAMELRPPDPAYERSLLPRLPKPWYGRAWNWLAGISHLAKWVDTKRLFVDDFNHQIAAWADMIAERSCCISLSDGFHTAHWYYLADPFKEEHLPPVYKEALEYTEFGIDQFKRRADRDGAQLAIISATGDMGTRGDPQFDRLSAIAETRGIPIISDYDYIVRQGYDAKDGRFRFNGHWNAAGHRWAAEALLEWLKENQDVCN